MITLQNALRDDKERVVIYIPSTNKLVSVAPVDARAILEAGNGILNWVVVKNAKGEELVVSVDEVTESDSVIRSAQYSDSKTKHIENLMSPRIVAHAVKESDGEDAETVDFDGYSDEELTAFGQIAGVSGTVKKRETLIAKLKKAGFKPE